VSSPAHVIAFELSHGSLPAGSKFRQTCGTHGCCRPEHLVELPALPRAPAQAERSTGAATKKAAPKPRRPYGSGGLRKVEEGVWEIRISWGGRNRFTGKYGTYTKAFHGSKAEAEADRLRGEAGAARYRPAPQAKAKDLFEAYLQWLDRQVRLGNMSPSTVHKSYRPRIGNYLIPHLGHYTLRRLEDGSVINHLYDAMLDEDWDNGGMTLANLATLHAVLSAVFGWGLKHRWFGKDQDPREHIDVPSAPNPTPKLRSPDEAVLLLVGRSGRRWSG
jgi:hypothetical protein